MDGNDSLTSLFKKKVDEYLQNVLEGTGFVATPLMRSVNKNIAQDEAQELYEYVTAAMTLTDSNDSKLVHLQQPVYSKMHMQSVKSILRNNSSVPLISRRGEQYFVQTAFILTREKVQEHGGDVLSAASKMLLKIQKNNSNANDYNFLEVHLILSRRWKRIAFKLCHKYTRNVHVVDKWHIRSTKYGTEEYFSLGRRIHSSDRPKLPNDSFKVKGNENVSCDQPQWSRVNSMGSSMWSESGYNADDDDQMYTEKQRAKLLHMKRNSKPIHLQQPLSFAWELSDSDGSNVGFVAVISSAESSNTERDYTVVVVKKRKLLSKKARDVIRKKHSQ